jgi:ribosomal protein S18 acetylase RimI-like enzyme
MAELRRARLTDAPALASVHLRSWAQSYRSLMPDAALDAMTSQAALDRRAQFWHKLLHKGREIVFVAVQGGEVVGFASGTTGTFLTDDFMADAEVFTLYLLNSAQGQGSGRALLRAMAAELAAQGAHSLLLWVLANNPARAFYEHLGGAVVGERQETVKGAVLEEVAYGWSDLRALL